MYYPIKNIQHIRIEYKKSALYQFLQKKFPEYDVLVWNFGYILKHPKKNIIKVYSQKNFYEKEKHIYELLYGKLCIPKIEEEFLIEDHYSVSFQNIRFQNIRYESIYDIPIWWLAKIMVTFHSYKQENGYCLLHGNFHLSHFFWNNKQIGIFDFVSCFYWEKEYDYALLYMISWYDDGFINRLLSYTQEEVVWKKIYTYTLLKLKENIIWNIYIDDDERKKLKKDLFKIQQKLWNLM